MKTLIMPPKKNKKKPELGKKHPENGEKYKYLYTNSNGRHYTARGYIVEIYINELNTFDLN